MFNIIYISLYTYIGNKHLYNLQKQDKVHSENNIIIAKGVNNLKNSSVATFRRPVLNDISSNLQTNKNDQKGKIAISKSTVAITKPITRLTSKYVY